MVVERLRARAGDRRPLCALYTPCESFELLAGSMDARAGKRCPQIIQGWGLPTEVDRRPAHGLAGAAPGWPSTASASPGSSGRWAAAWTPWRSTPGLRPASPSCSSLERCARLTGRTALAERCLELREQPGRSPIRQTMAAQPQDPGGLVEKKVACDYLAVRGGRSARSGNPAVAAEVAFHFANLLKVSRVEGTRFNAGRC